MGARPTLIWRQATRVSLFEVNHFTELVTHWLHLDALGLDHLFCNYMVSCDLFHEV